MSTFAQQLARNETFMTETILLVAELVSLDSHEGSPSHRCVVHYHGKE